MKGLLFCKPHMHSTHTSAMRELCRPRKWARCLPRGPAERGRQHATAAAAQMRRLLRWNLCRQSQPPAAGWVQSGHLSQWKPDLQQLDIERAALTRFSNLIYRQRQATSFVCR